MKYEIIKNINQVHIQTSVTQAFPRAPMTNQTQYANIQGMNPHAAFNPSQVIFTFLTKTASQRQNCCWKFCLADSDRMIFKSESILPIFRL